MSSTASTTGYAQPRSTRLLSDGCEDRYELWETKFMGHLRVQKLHGVMNQNGSEEGYAENNALIYAELVQLLDDKSLSLIMRDAKDNGKGAIKILRDHFMGSSKPRIISLYTELTSLKKSGTETVTDYMLRAEGAATSLKNAGEQISDSLLVAMCLKGLPDEYQAFSTVIAQSDKVTSFSEFKVALKSFEESQICRSVNNSASNIMTVKSNDNKNVKCYNCGRLGHKKYQCNSKSVNEGNSENKSYSSNNRWCRFCKTKTHDTNYCRKKSSAKSINDNCDGNKEDSFIFKVSLDASDSSCTDSLLVDCGATAHIINDSSKFSNFDKDFNASAHVIELADGSRSNNLVTGKGDANVVIHDKDGKPCNLTLKQALCIPSYNQDIFSVHAATKNGARVEFESDCGELIAPNGTIFDIKKNGKLYYLNNINTAKSTTRSLKEWHSVLGHCNVRDVLNLESVVDGMKITSKNDFQCKVCIESKMTENRSRIPDKRAEKPLQFVHCDLAGPVETESKEGFKYAVVFVDDYSSVNIVYCIKKKSDTPLAFEKFLADTSPYGTVERLRSDNGTEFTSSDFQDIILKNKIKHEFSAPASAHQNGTAERSWRSLFEMARCILNESKLPKFLWPHAVKTASYIRNRCFNNRIRKTPLELFTGNRPNLSNMYKFGTTCFAYVQNKKKMDARSRQGTFIGYDSRSPAYLVYFPETCDIQKVRCVKFTTDDSYDDPSVLIHRQEDDKCNNETSTSATNPPEQINRYPKRDRKTPKHLDDYEVTYNDDDDADKCSIDYCYKLSCIPSTYQEAIKSPECSKWKEAMDKEITALQHNDSYEVVPLPPDHHTIGSKWVYSAKVGPNGDEKLKARFVAKEYSQKQDIDYQETFSPTVRSSSIRMLMQIAIDQDLIVHQMDFKSAYLHANIDKELYVEQPEGYEKLENGVKLVLKLKKSLYGLRQSGRNFYSLLSSFLDNEGFEQSLVDNCVYTKISKLGRVIIITWADDLIIATNNETILNDCKDKFQCKFQMKDIGQLKHFLGINFNFTGDCITMDQRTCQENILDKFKMSDCIPKPVPCDININNVSQCDSDMVDPKLYREMVGKLIYLMTNTRPDITFAVTKLSQYSTRPTRAHLNLVKNVLRYLKSTLDYKLTFKKSTDGLKLVGFSDSDWGSSDDRKSISGYCFFLNSDGPSISWKSKKQPIVTLSSCEAEYVALTQALQEAKFLQQLFSDMYQSNKECVTIFADNRGAIDLSKKCYLSST